MSAVLNKVCLIVLYVCFEVSSSEDEGTLSGTEKLISCLEKLTKLVVESVKSTDAKESGIFSPASELSNLVPREDASREYVSREALNWRACLQAGYLGYPLHQVMT